MARARVVHAFYLRNFDAWTVGVEIFQGVIRLGHIAAFKLASIESGPHVVIGISSHATALGRATFDLLTRGSDQLKLDRFIGGVVDTIDAP